MSVWVEMPTAYSELAAKLVGIWVGTPVLYVVVVVVTLVLNRYTPLGRRPQDPMSKQFRVIGLCVFGSAILFTVLVLTGEY